ncbi:hypothetical protein [Kaarinaea lacus]
MKTDRLRFLVWLFLSIGICNQAAAQESKNADLAQELTNPIADIVTLPIQINFDDNIGINDEGSKTTTNIQPVIPIEINQDWNLITRTIFPIISQDNIYPGAGSQSGLGDITEQLFFSPKKPTAGGIIWGVGAVLIFPTASDSKLGTEKWSLGPAGVAITMRGPWTLGALGNHAWSVAGDSDRADISNTFLQPFAAYTWPSAWTAAIQSESNYNWKSKKWSIPVNVAISKLVFLGKLPVSLQAGVGYWMESPDTGPEGVRYRLQANIVLPKKLFTKGSD